MCALRVVTEHNGKEIETHSKHRFAMKCVILSLYGKRFGTREKYEGGGHFAAVANPVQPNTVSRVDTCITRLHNVYSGTVS